MLVKSPGRVPAQLDVTVSDCVMEPMFSTVKENGAFPAAELMIVGP